MPAENALPNYDVPTVWTQGFDFTEDQFETHEEGAYGVPEEVVPAIADAVLHQLMELDLELHEVCFIGTTGEETLEQAWGVDEQDHDEDTYFIPSDEVDTEERLMQQDDDAYAQSAENRHGQEVLRWLGGPERPLLIFSGAFDLRSPAETRSNPIHRAGITRHSAILVFDKTTIGSMALAQGGAGDVLSLHALQDELSVAARAIVRLRYTIDSEQPY